ncbi:MAG TPA: MotA/TolQ/ExbB proton channel family protein [Persephonella sp.]|nr:MotA/TolQ/ExbB proton channel family protein [Hydrogenothermaceae bacterium]HIQ24405.1 MotA/TolQ/ExbB proton channel family protein [Persephonella sp.]
MEYIITIFQKGGILMYPLLFLGILSVAFIIERLYSLSTRKIIPLKAIEEIVSFLNENKIEEAMTVSKTYPSTATSIIYEILNAYLKGKKDLEELKLIAEETARLEVPKLEGYTGTIGAIASIAPLLGFLGTVIGMIQVFEALSLEGLSNPKLLSAGISQALITTAFGLSIAIPSLAGYWYIKSKINLLVAQVETVVFEIIELLSSKDEN